MPQRSRQRIHKLLLLLALVCSWMVSSATGFHTPVSPCVGHNPYNRINNNRLAPVGLQQPMLSNKQQRPTTSTSLFFMGTDGGLLGVGTPEVFTILLIGYFVLGPSDLYKVVKEVGKFITNLRTLSSDLSTTFENNMESQLQLEDLRKAQRELNEAFSFRRSINTTPDEEAFATNVETPRATQELQQVGSDAKKKIRRRVRKKTIEEIVPDLEMPMTMADTDSTAEQRATTDWNGIPTAASEIANPDTDTDNFKAMTAEELAVIDNEFEQYTSITANGFNEPTLQDGAMNSSIGTTQDNTDDATAQSLRFQQQLASNTWNDSILKNQDKLEPLAQIMKQLALLEQERSAATARLKEEFAARRELEDEFYRKQRQVLEAGAAQVQQEVMYATTTTTTKTSVGNNE